MKGRTVKWLTRLGSPLLLLLILAVVVLIRGTWADTVLHDPTAPEDGITCQLFLTPDGHKSWALS